MACDIDKRESKPRYLFTFAEDAYCDSRSCKKLLSYWPKKLNT